MVNFFKPAIANNLVAGLAAIAFTTAVITPPSCHAVGVNLDQGAINFVVLFTKLHLREEISSPDLFVRPKFKKPGAIQYNEDGDPTLVHQTVLCL